MSSTRLQVRQEAATRLGSVLISTATSGATSTLTDAINLLDVGASAYRYDGAWLLLTGGANVGRIVRVTSYLPGAGALGFSPTFGAAIVATDGYELHDVLSPLDWNRAIDRGLRKCVRVRRYSITPVANQLQYTLPSWIERATDVLGLLQQTGSALQKAERPIGASGWTIYEDNDGITLHLESAYRPDAVNSLALVVVAVGSYDPLATDGAVTTCPLDLVTWATITEAHEIYGKSIAASERRDELTDAVTAAQRFTTMLMKYSPQIARDVRLPRW